MFAGSKIRNWIRTRDTNRNRLLKKRPIRLQLSALEERAVPATITVTDNTDNTTVNGTVSIREAINAINAGADSGDVVASGSYGDNDTILFAGGLTSPISLASGQLPISKALTITGPGAGTLTIKNTAAASATSRVFDINVAVGDPTITITGLTLSGGNLSSGNSGGAIRVNNDPLLLDGMTLSGNKSASTGGAIGTTSSTPATITIKNSTFTGNMATTTGGAIHGVNTLVLDISNTTFGSNTATSTGGAINLASASTVTLTNANFTSNNSGSTGGAINCSTAVTLTITGSTFDSNIGTSGGAIRGASTTTFNATDTVFSNNTGTTGGALSFGSFTASTITLDRCTVSGNIASGLGGGVYGSSSTTFNIRYSAIINNTGVGGGGIRVSTAPLNVLNTTISGNKSTGTSATTGGGGILIGGAPSVTIRNSTIVNNSATNQVAVGGGIFVNNTGGTITLDSTIVAQNSNFNNLDFGVSGARDVAGSNNFFGSIDSALINLTGSSNQKGTEVAPLSPGLFLLGSNGGGTKTHGLQYTSPALNIGSNLSALSFDQRGNPNPREVPFGQPDIGAFEGTLPIPFPTSNTITNVSTGGASVYTFTVTYDDETGIKTASLGADDVNVTGPAAVGAIVFKGFTTSGNQVKATYEFAPPLGTWDVADNGSYTISLVGGSVQDVDGTTHSVEGQTLGVVRVTVPNIYLVNQLGDVDDGLPNNGMTTLREAINLSNSKNVGFTDIISFDSSIDGMTITLAGTEFSITDPVVIQGNGSTKTIISGNNASRIFNFGITALKTESQISGVTLTNGKATGTGSAGSGGAILLGNDFLTLTNVVVTASQSQTQGGGISVEGAHLRVFDSTISNNTGTGQGGGIGIINSTAGDASIVDITRTTVSGNTSTSNGGGLYTQSARFNVTDSTISGNTSNQTTATTGGGGIRIGDGTLSVINSTISGNQAPNSAGGGILVTSTGKVTVQNSTITNNSAKSGAGGLAFSGSSTTTLGTLTITSSIVAQNTNTTHPDLFATPTNFSATINDSLVGVNSGGIATINGSNNQMGSPGSELDAKLAPMANYGGPTQMHGLLPGSPALDKGSNTIGLTNDQRGTGFPRVVNGTADVGAFEGELKIPIATAKLTNVTTAGGATYQAVVEYTDETGINVGSIDINDVKLNGPGFGGPVSPTSVMTSGSGTKVTATYTFDAPGGTWGPSDNGVYSLTMVASQVFDTDVPTPNAALAGTIGTFKSAIPQNYEVNQVGDVDDGNPNNGLTTLREAVNLANSAPTSVGVQDIITFDAALNGQTITLAGSELGITEAVIIQGPGAGNLTISGNSASRIFNIAITGAGNDVQISGLTLTKGQAPASASGGAIVMTDDSLTLTGVTITDSSATTTGGGVGLTTGTLKLIDSTVANNTATTTGGGVNASSGSITITRSTLSGNTATTRGGGAYISSGTLTVTESTISGNFANVATSNGGGGISFSTGTVNIRNSTVSGNTAVAVGGGINISSSGKLNIDNSTIFNNTANGNGGGGIGSSATSASTQPTINIASTIIAGNFNNFHPDLYTAATSVTLTANINDSIIGLDTGSVAINGTNNQSNIDPLLAPLGNYGGPTQTHGLKPGSPALDKGSNSIGLTTDQRGIGFSRVLNGVADVGSTEGVLLNPTATATLANVTVSGATYEAIVDYADETGINVGSIGPDDVLLSGPGFAMPVSPVSFSTSGSGLMVQAKYTFNAPGGNWTNAHNGPYTLTMVAGKVFDTDAPTPHSVLPGALGTFHVSIPRTFIVNQIGDADDGDPNNGLATLREAINLANVNFDTTDTITFSASIDGQTIVLASELKISEPVVIQGNGSPMTKISGNNVTRIFNFVITGAGTESKFSDLTLMAGKVTGSGGAILLNDDALTITNAVISGNEASSTGGAIQLTGTTLKITNSAFSNNKTTGSSGGAVATSTTAAVIEVTNSSFSGHTASSLGGAFYLNAGTATITNSTITANTAQNSSYGGGGLDIGGATVTISNSTISNNVASGSSSDGGGIRLHTSTGRLTINASTISGNTSTAQGGGIAVSAGKLYLNDSTLSKNVVSSASSSGFNYGGGLSLSGTSTTSATLVNCTISGNQVINTSTGGFILGGGIRVGTGVLTVNNSTITDNMVSGSATVTNGGGGIGLTLTSATITLNSSIVAQNHHSVDPDLFGTPTATVTIFANDSLIGAVTDASLNVIGAYQSGTLASPLDAQLAPLGNYGGPTQTHPLSPTSPAIDLGNNNLALSFDQRGTGFPRVVGSQADVGAFEGVSPIPLAFANLADVTTAGGTSYTFTITYSDDVGINTGTLGDDDVEITGAGFPAPIPAKFKSFSGTGGKIDAVYSFTPPGGAWDGFDNGTYTVSIKPSSVSDGTNFVPAGAVDTFQVGIAANFVVDSNADEDDTNYGAGDLTLREAVRLSNSTLVGSSTIGFAGSLNGKTITLSLGELAFMRSMIINGPGASQLTISGNNASRIFNIDDGNSATHADLSISGLTLTAGKSTGDGGAINDLNENLSLTGLTITGNSATGSAADGGGLNVDGNGATITIIGCTFSNNSAGTSGDADGGAMDFEGDGTFVIKGTTIDNNTANDDGGGILFFHTITANRTVLIENSAITNNKQTAATGGYGGGVNFGGQFDSLVIRNSTISGNTTNEQGGGLQFYNVDSATSIQNTTIAFNNAAKNGGGINQYKGSNASQTSEGTILLQSTIVSDNIGSIGPDVASVDGFVNAEKSALGVLSVPNYFDDGMTLINQPLMLGPLQNNGGPTPTHALLAGSAAINAGNNPAALTTDQRGFKREVGGQIDIGAYESQPPRVTAVLVNDGAVQRSLVKTIRVSFSEPVSFPSGMAAAFDVSRYAKATPNASGLLGSVALDIVQSGLDYIITFKSGGTVGVDLGNSLEDGQYKLTLNADKVSGNGGTLDGDGDFLSEGSPADNSVTAFHRLYGDGNGDGNVNSTDFAQFRTFFGLSGPSIFDYNNDNNTNSNDFAEFRKRFGLSGYLP